MKEKSHDYLGVYPLQSLCTELQKLEKYHNTNILKLFLTVASHEKLKSANKKEGKKTPKTGDKDHNSIRKYAFMHNGGFENPISYTAVIEVNSPASLFSNLANCNTLHQITV